MTKVGQLRSMLAISCLVALLPACQKKSGREDIARLYPAEVTALATEGGTGLPFFVGKELRPVWKTQGTPKPRVLTQFHLTDQNGKDVSSEQLRGKVAVVSFFFTDCPGICPMTTRNLRAVQDKFKDNDRLMLLSLSISPDRDTPSKLKNFAKKYGIDSHRWKLATGKREAIYQLARESFNADTFSERENNLMKVRPQDFLHSENVYLLDSEQRLRGIYAGRSVASVEELARDAEQLL